MPAGQTLKSLRNKRNVTVREVEQASRRIAEFKGDKRFCISNGWLAQLENGVSKPSMWKLFSLSVIYHADFRELARLYDVDVDDKEIYEPIADPNLTQLLSDKSNGNGSALLFSQAPIVTSLEPMTVSKNGDMHIVYARLGLAELTMYPMIRPGALLKIDTKQNKPGPVAWHNEYERPIFFIELRGGFTCGWCDLQGNQLLIIPHHSSPEKVRRLTYPREAEIVGPVISYSTSCVDLETDQSTIKK